MSDKESIWWYVHTQNSNPRLNGKHCFFQTGGLHTKKEMDHMDQEAKKNLSPYSIFNGPYLRVRQKYDPYARIYVRSFNRSWRNEGIREQWIAEWLGLA